MDTSQYSYLTKTEAQYGRGITIYGWREHKSGVLKGQMQRCFITTVEDEAEAEELFPEAGWSNRWMEPQPSFTHLEGRDW